MEWKKVLKKTWYFLWHDNSIWSWVANILIAFILIKFVVYPVIGLVFTTSHPIVAVVSSSMEHSDSNFDVWWNKNADYYEGLNITNQEFNSFVFNNGFNKGDLMLLRGKKSAETSIGDILVFNSGGSSPIIHRVVKKWKSDKFYFQTKGDNNKDSIKSSFLDETNINEDRVVGVAFMRVPLLGWIKIWFVNIVQFIGGVFS